MGALTKIQYNGLTIEDQGKFVVTSWGGLDSVSIRTSKDNLVNADGGRIWNQRYNMRKVWFEGYIYANTAEEYFQAKREFIRAFSIVNARYSPAAVFTNWAGTMKFLWNARVVNTPFMAEVSGRANYCEFRVELESEDAFLRGIGGLRILTPSQQKGLPLLSGLPLMTGLPLQAEGESDEVWVQNEEDIPGIIDLTFYGNVLNPGITNISTNQSISLEMTIPLGQRVDLFNERGGIEAYLRNASDATLAPDGSTTIDFSKYETVPYLDNVFRNVRGTYPYLQKGVNQYKLTGTPVGSDSYFAILLYSPRYMAL